MRFRAEHGELRDGVRSLLALHRGDEAWRLLAEQVGAPGLAVPDRFGGLVFGDSGFDGSGCDEVVSGGSGVGGAGFGPLETHVVMEELGRALAETPFFSSSVLATQALVRCEASRTRDEWLTRLADGSATAALAWAEEGTFAPTRFTARAEADDTDGTSGTSDINGTGDTDGTGGPGEESSPSAPSATGDASATGDVGDASATAGTTRRTAGTAGWTLTGRKRHVLGADAADLLIVAAATDDGPGLFAVVPDAEGVSVDRRVPVDLSRPQADVALQRAEAVPLSPRGETVEAVLSDVLAAACTALSAEQVGGAARCVEMTVEYVKTREQFGRPIGSFQAVKHRLADMYVALESARSLSYAAAFALDAGATGAWTDASAAKAACSEAYREIAGEAIQLHGGNGVTWEHEAQLHFKRAHASALMLGAPEWHRRRLADVVARGGAAAGSTCR